MVDFRAVNIILLSLLFHSFSLSFILVSLFLCLCSDRLIIVHMILKYVHRRLCVKARRGAETDRSVKERITNDNAHKGRALSMVFFLSNPICLLLISRGMFGSPIVCFLCLVLCECIILNVISCKFDCHFFIICSVFSIMTLIVYFLDLFCFCICLNLCVDL